MKKRTIILFSVLELLLVLVQSLIVRAWMHTDIIQQFMDVFRSFYPAIPKWSLLVFGTKPWCWIFPAACVLLYVAALLWRRQFITLLVVNFISFLVLAGMIYAMYPLGQMPSMVMRDSRPNILLTQNQVATLRTD